MKVSTALAMVAMTRSMTESVVLRKIVHVDMDAFYACVELVGVGLSNFQAGEHIPLPLFESRLN
jgi:hypothetical protein